MLDLAFYAVGVLNVLWFSAAFHYFSIKQIAAAKVLVPKSSRNSPLFLTIAASVRFLGGMNLAFAVLSLLMLLGLLASNDRDARSALFLVLTVAHGSQFYFNIPIARGGGRQGESLWDVHQGPMNFIYRVDATLMSANAILSVIYFSMK
jgi:hypothetical protein